MEDSHLRYSLLYAVELHQHRTKTQQPALIRHGLVNNSLTGQSQVVDPARVILLASFLCFPPFTRAHICTSIISIPLDNTRVIQYCGSSVSQCLVEASEPSSERFCLCGSVQWRGILYGHATIQSWRSIAAQNPQSSSGDAPSGGIGLVHGGAWRYFALPVTYFLLFSQQFRGLLQLSARLSAGGFWALLSPCCGSISWYPLGSHPVRETWR